MSFCDDAWDAITPIRQAIDKLPFLTGLSDGNLPRQSFTYYMAQDAHYLQDFGRIHAMAAGQAGDPDELLFWINSARSAVLVERQLHATHVADFDAAPRSPTGTAYTSFLLSLTTVGCHPTLVAGILPCFWIYEDVGRRLKADIADLATHPYGDWIATYGEPASPPRPTTPRRSPIDWPPNQAPSPSSACTKRSSPPPATSCCSGRPPGTRRPGQPEPRQDWASCPCWGWMRHLHRRDLTSKVKVRQGSQTDLHRRHPAAEEELASQEEK